MVRPRYFSDTAATDPWRARIHTSAGNVLAAGIVLDERYVLTCAHVVARHTGPDAAGWPLLVDAVGKVPVVRRQARIAPDGWVPLRPNVDHAAEGDLAVLELDSPIEANGVAPLHTMSIHRELPVWTYGFPSASGGGVWVAATVRGTSGELVQIDTANGRGAEIEHGFSGSGVVDEHGHVVGMVVSKLLAGARGIAWMMPVETMIATLPHLERYVVSGIRRTDPSLVLSRSVTDQTVAVVQEVSGLLAAPGNQLLIVLGPHGDRPADVIGLLARLADPRTRATTRDTLTPDIGTLPPAGSVDLALNVAGKTADQVARCIGERLGLPATNTDELLDGMRRSSAPATIMVDAADDSAEPGRLFRDLLVPISELDRGRVVATVRADPGIAASNATVVRMTDPTPPRTFAEWLERLDDLVAQVRSAEAEAVRAAPQFVDVPVQRPKGDSLLIQMEVLRAGPYGPSMAGHLRETETVAIRALGAARAITERPVERDELSRRLRLYQAMASARGRAEDPVLNSLYDRAYQVSRQVPCDLDALRGAVRHYLRAVWRALGVDPPTDGGVR